MLARQPLVIEYDPQKTGKAFKFQIGFTRALDSYTGWFHLKVNGQQYEQITLLREHSTQQLASEDVFEKAVADVDFERGNTLSTEEDCKRKCFTAQVFKLNGQEIIERGQTFKWSLESMKTLIDDKLGNAVN